MAYLPLVLVLVVAMLGVLARFYSNARLSIPYRPQLAAIGGYSAGLLLSWLLLSTVRTICLLPLASQFGFSSLVLSPLYLFRIELWIAMFFAVRECTYLDGTYTALTEWNLSLIDGCKAIAVPIAISTLFFFPSWWLLQPEKYGNFRGSFVEGLVSPSASEVFSAAPTTTDLKRHGKLQTRAPIPHAIVVAAGVAVFLMIALRGAKYVLGTLGETYLHLPPKPKSNDGNRWPFNPRGGGAN